MAYPFYLFFLHAVLEGKKQDLPSKSCEPLKRLVCPQFLDELLSYSYKCDFITLFTFIFGFISAGKISFFPSSENFKKWQFLPAILTSTHVIPFMFLLFVFYCFIIL